MSEGLEDIWLSDSDASDVVLFPDAEDLMNDEEEEQLKVPVIGNFQNNESESDSSEDEGILNRVGDIPLAWYKNEEHIGYDIEGRKLKRSEKSALERLLEAADDPNAFRTIYDALHDEKKALSNADLELIFNLQRNRVPNAGYDMYADYSVGNVEFDPLKPSPSSH